MNSVPPTLTIDLLRRVVSDVDFSEASLPVPVGRITSLRAPHRVADAILRDSEYEGVRFRESVSEQDRSHRERPERQLARGGDGQIPFDDPSGRGESRQRALRKRQFGGDD